MSSNIVQKIPLPPVSAVRRVCEVKVPVAVRLVVAIFEEVELVMVAFTAVMLEPENPGAEKFPETERLVAVAFVRVALVTVRFVNIAVKADKSELNKLLDVEFVNVALLDEAFTE